MPQSNTPPPLFDRALLKIRRARALGRLARSGEPAFIHMRTIEDLSERIMDVGRQFNHALIIGRPDTTHILLGHLPPHKRPKTVTTAFFGPTTHHIDVSAHDTALPFAPATFDLVISMLSLHSVQDLPGALAHIRGILKPDGLFIGALFGGQTLTELRQSLYMTDEHILGHMSARIHPAIDYTTGAGLLQQAGFALPVIDTDRFQVNYRNLARLMSDIRDLGEGNILKARDKTPLSRRYWEKLKTNYRDQFGLAGKYTATFEILWLTGWHPHESQQKPLAPGSAQTRLVDALKTVRDKSKNNQD